MKKVNIILLIFFSLSCSKQKKLSIVDENNHILAERYIVYNNFPSKYVIPRDIEIWLPKQYNIVQSLPVLYMFDGESIFHGRKGWIGGQYDHGWQVDETLDSLFVAGLTPPIIVVGIFNTGIRRASEYMPAQPKKFIQARIKLADDWIKKGYNDYGITSDPFLKFIVEELKPFVDNNYKTQKNRQSTYLAGSSMGGLISAYAICEYPEIFGGAACLSTHWPALDGVFIEYLKKNIPDPNFNKFYFDFGTLGLDSKYEPYQLIVDSIMIANGYEKNVNWVTKKFVNEDHNGDFWRKRFHHPIKFLLSNN